MHAKIILNISGHNTVWTLVPDNKYLLLAVDSSHFSSNNFDEVLEEAQRRNVEYIEVCGLIHDINWHIKGF